MLHTGYIKAAQVSIDGLSEPQADALRRLARAIDVYTPHGWTTESSAYRAAAAEGAIASRAERLARALFGSDLTAAIDQELADCDGSLAANRRRFAPEIAAALACEGAIVERPDA